MHCNALKPLEIEHDVLPLYEKYRVPFDVFTFQNLSKMYLNMMEVDKVIEMWQKS